MDKALTPAVLRRMGKPATPATAVPATASLSSITLTGVTLEPAFPASEFNYTRHALDLCCAALERHNQRTRRQRSLAYFRPIAASVQERPESCVLTPVGGRFANIHNGNYYGAYTDASLYRSTVSRVLHDLSESGRC